MTIGEIIQLARDEDVSFTRQAHTHRALRSRVASYQKELLGRAVVIAPDEFARPLDVPLPIPVDGYELFEPVEEGESEPEDPVPLQWTVIQPRAEAIHRETAKLEVQVVARQAQWGAHRTAPVWILGNRIYAAHNPGFWRPFTTLRFFYVPAPPDELGELDETMFGSRGDAVFRWYLAWFMARRRPKEVARPVDEFERLWREAEAELLHDLAGRSPKTDRIREVW